MIQYSLGNTLLDISKVTLKYGDRTILNEVTAQVKDILVPGRITGQIVGILGPSGCGKTTLFRIIAGLLTPTSGVVNLSGSNQPVVAGQVGVVAQGYPLFENRTIFGNLMLAAKMKEKDSKIASDKVMEMLTQFNLADKADLYPINLSGGQRQRIAIIQQILCSEHFLLMDEPFSGLDLVMLEKTCELISKVANLNELNTIVIVTHDVTSACAVANNLWLMGKTEGIEGSRIVKEYDLISEGLCWTPGITSTNTFTDFVREVKQDFRRL